MRRLPIYLTLFVLLLGAASVRAQGGPPPPPPPPPSPDYFPEQWKEYVYEVDNVRFRFPVEPEVTTASTNESFGTVTNRHYRRRSFVRMQLSVHEFPAHADFEAEGAKGLLAQMVEASLAEIKDENPKVIKESDITVDGHAGKFLHIETGSGKSIRYKFFLVRNRMYNSYAEVKKGARHGHNFENDFEKVAMGFLDSIRLAAPAK